MTLLEAFEPLKAGARAVRMSWSGTSYSAVAQRAFAGLDQGFTPLIKAGFARADVLDLLDKTRAYGVSERSIRRAQSIRQSPHAVAAEGFAKLGLWSLEVVEHITLQGSNDTALTFVKVIRRR